MLSYTRFLLLLEDKKEFLQKKYNIDNDTMSKLASIDPTPRHKHLEWLALQHKKGNLDINNEQHIEHHNKALKDLTRFPVQLTNESGKNIPFKDVYHLNNSIYDHIENDPKIKEKWGERVFNKDGHEIWKSSTPKHCETHGEGTSWCTAIKKGLHQRNYFGEDKPALYTHYPKNTPKPEEPGHTKGNRFQFYAGEDDYTGSDYGKKPELGNSANHPINPDTHEHSFPVLKQSKHWNEFKNAWHNHDIHQFPDEYDHDEGYEDPHDLAHSQDHNDRVRAVELGYHREEDGHHLITDDHHSVKEAVLDYERTRRGQDEHRYQNILNQVHAASPVDDRDNEEIHHHISQYTKNPDILHKYATGPRIDDEYEHLIHSNVAQNHHTKPEDLLHLAKTSNHWRVHLDLAANARTPEEGIQEILKHSEGPDGTYHYIVSRQGGDKYMDQIAKHTNPHARRVAAMYTNDPEHLKMLHMDLNPRVHEELAKRFPEKEYTFPDKNVRYQAAHAVIGHYVVNRDEPLSDKHKEILKHLANPNDEHNAIYVRREVAKHPEMHDHMINDTWEIQSEIAKSTSNHEHLKRLVKAPDAYTRQLASSRALTLYKNADHPKMQEIYDHMALSGNNNEMELAARHSKNPDTLHHLATVSNSFHIHHAVVRRPEVSTKTLNYLQNKYKEGTGAVIDLHRDIEYKKAQRGIKI